MDAYKKVSISLFTTKKMPNSKSLYEVVT